MGNYDEYYRARKIISDILSRDLIGPVTENEIILERPTKYYIMGKLYPLNSKESGQDTARNPILENGIDTYDSFVSLSNQSEPSSMGITCTVKREVSSIRISGSFSFYVSSKKTGDSKSVKWKREAKSFSEIFEVPRKGCLEKKLDNNMKLCIFNQAELPDGDHILTVVLLNSNTITPNQHGQDLDTVAEFTAFQPELRIGSIDGSGIFSDSNHYAHVAGDNTELKELNLLYSDVHSYGQGHSCACVWDGNDPSEIRSSFFPKFDFHQTMARASANNEILKMSFLSSGSKNVILADLGNLVDDYKSWIDETRNHAALLDEEKKKTAMDNMETCMKAHSLMKKSIESLGKDPVAFRAFQLANEAMYEQRRHGLLKEGKQADPDKIKWYPFQLEFILKEILSFTEPESAERKTVDLLWFPTGGGKTEAYLGIVAFVIFYRRLHDENSDGVTAIMSYTLRLLTLQQFERASTLICACEYIRKKYHIGGNEISIGLWVGGHLTPNDLASARSSIRKQQEGNEEKSDSGNPVQVLRCPWCGKKLSVSDYHVDVLQKRMQIICSNDQCLFHEGEGLPIHVIDEAIYQYQPTFLITTIDKFAQIPLQENPAALFGKNNGKKPPELIIQDELHLISGPLGTMVGIYEPAITKFCENNGIPVKIIASTATIRNAKEQIRELYGRDYSQFPPQGISARDSYFAVEADESKRPTRQYCGVMGIDISATSALIRVYADLLFGSRYLSKSGFSDDVVDSYWTITGYFNSLRELGGASTQIMDDVQSRYSYLKDTKFKQCYPVTGLQERYEHITELTSRMDNKELTDIIQNKLKNRYMHGDNTDVFDFVLASNMISVGVDVGRLGVMVVTGQPKTNSEYIQATSRVGRSNPGLVVTVYNPARSRDRSHYEQFTQYHSALYRYVEATSLTPFADRARDRGLQALYVSLVRYCCKGMLSNSGAGNYDKNREDIKYIESEILNYASSVDPQEMAGIKNDLEDIEDTWQEMADENLVYRKNGTAPNIALLQRDSDEMSRFRMMNSMRSVDSECNVFLAWRKNESKYNK